MFVILDFDDTILATTKVRVPTLLLALREFGSNIDRDTLMVQWGRPFKEVILAVSPEINFEEFFVYYSNLMEKTSPEVLPGVVNFLKAQSDQGRLILVISSSRRDLIKQDLLAANLLQYVTDIWGHEDTPVHKPNPQVIVPLLKFLALKNIPTERGYYVGDSTQDFEVASGNNIEFYAVLTGSTTRETFERAGVGRNKIYQDFEELINTNPQLMLP